MNISQTAMATGMPAKTIRYYEEIGLIAPARGENGYRSFSQQDVHKLGFLGRARELGFSIQECRALLALYEDRGRASADVKEIAQQHLQDIDAKMTKLAAMRATLADLVSRCSGDHRPDCPILEDLAIEQSGRVD